MPLLSLSRRTVVSSYLFIVSNCACFLFLESVSEILLIEYECVNLSPAAGRAAECGLFSENVVAVHLANCLL